MFQFAYGVLLERLAAQISVCVGAGAALLDVERLAPRSGASDRALARWFGRGVGDRGRRSFVVRRARDRAASWSGSAGATGRLADHALPG
jgi:hypothetical protein